MGFNPFRYDEEKHDHPAVRLLLYVVGVGLGALALGGLMFLLQTGVLFRPIAKYNMRNIEKSNARIALWTKLAAGAGALWALGLCVRHELRVQSEADDEPRR